MSFAALWRMAAQENAQRQIAALEASEHASEFTDELDSVSADLADIESPDSVSSDTVILHGLTVAEVETLYAEIEAEADQLFGRYQDAVLALRAEGESSPTRLQILRHISQHQTQINIVHLSSDQVNALIDFYIDHADVDTGEQISSRLTPEQRASAEQRRAEILLEAIVMGSILTNKAKQEGKLKKEKKKEKVELEREHDKFIQKMIQEQRSRGRKKKK